MEGFKVVLLGLFQGMTEFLPISSSGHLVVFGKYLRYENSLSLTLFLHLGTLVAVIFFLRREIKWIFSGLFRKGRCIDPGRRLILLIIIGNIPAAIMGLCAKDLIAGLFKEDIFVANMLILNGLILLIAECFSGNNGRDVLGIGNAIIIGLSQAISIIPGISRSGMTIATAMILGISREVALTYSFLLLIPLVLGASIIELISTKDILIAKGLILPYLLGGVAAFLSGLACLELLFLTIKKRIFKSFAIYCILLGIGVILL